MAKHDKLIERFWKKVDKVGAGDTCWEWTGYRNIYRGGYGEFVVDVRKKPRKMKKVYAHRFAWTLEYGSIPKGMQVCHTCDNSACCRASHLYLGTAKDNNDDMTRKNRRATGEKVGSSKLTELYVKLIRKEFKRIKKGPYRFCLRMAKKFKVHVTTIDKVVKMRTWRHV